MKRFLVYILFLLLGHVSFGQTMYLVEIYADGSPIPSSNNLFWNSELPTSPSVTWKLTNEDNGKSIELGVDEYLDWFIDDASEAVDGGSWIVINLYDLEQKGTLEIGTNLTLTLTVNDVNHPLYGYSGSASLVNDNTGYQMFPGALNLTGAAKLDIKVTPNPLTLCKGATSGNVLTATVTGGDGSETVTWELASGGAIAGLATSGKTANFSGVDAGTYSVVAKAGSVTSDPVTVTVNPKPEVASLTPNKTEGCYDTELVLTATPKTGNPADYNYEWSGVTSNSEKATTKFPKGLKSDFAVQITDKTTGCRSDVFVMTTSVVGHYAEVTITGPSSVNHSATADLTATVNTIPTGDAVKGYQWSGGTFTGASTAATVTTGKITEDVTYKVEVTTSELGCKFSDEHPITVGDRLLVTATGNSGCEGSSFGVTSSPTGGDADHYTYEWKPSAGLTFVNTGVQNPQVATSVPAGRYTATVVVNDGNTSVESDPVEIVVHANPEITSFTPSKPEGCYNESVTLTVVPKTTGDYSYEWTGASGSTNVATTTFPKGPKNDYAVEITDRTTRCSARFTMTPGLIGHYAEVSISGPASVNNGATANLVATVNRIPSSDAVKYYEWSGGPVAGGVTGGAELSNITTGSITGNLTYKVEVTTSELACKFSNTHSITTIGSALTVEATGNSGCAGSDIVVSCRVEGGSGDFDFTWHPSAGLTFVDPSVQHPKVDPSVPAGTYTATVDVSDGVVTIPSNEIQITVRPAPVLTNIKATPPSGTNSVTATLSVDVNPASGVELRWTPENLIGSGTTLKSAITVPLTETQKFTVTANLGGCTATDEVTVTVTKQEMTGLTIEGAEGCAGSTMSLSVTPQGGVPNYNYTWGNSTPAGVVLSNTGISNPAVMNSGELSGTYSIPVTVTDAAGQRRDGFATLVIYPRVEANGSGFCNDVTTFDGQIEVTSGTAPYTVYEDAAGTKVVNGVQWTGNQGRIPNLLSGTYYTYYVKDKNNCNAARVTLTADCECGAQLVMVPGTKACAGDNAEIELVLRASGGTSYSFELVNVELGTKTKVVRNEAGPEWKVPIRYAERGRYRVDNFKAVTAQTAPGACEGNVTPSFVDVQFWPAPVVDAGEDLLVCGNEEVILKGSGDKGLTYTWDKGVEDGVGFNPPMGRETEYTVTGTDGHGCFKTDKVKVAAYEKPDVIARAVPNVVCKGEVVTLSHDGNANDYRWDNGGVDGANNVPMTTTRYTLTGTNSTTGCSDTSSVLVVVNMPAEISDRPKDRTIAIGKDVTFKIGALGNNLKYQWQWFDKTQNIWQSFTNTASGNPRVSGATTEELKLEGVPQSWDGTKVKCIVQGDCGDPAEAEAMLYVKECFDIVVDLKMKDGIRPSESSEQNVDGWYCKGNRIALQAVVALADPDNGVVANPHFTWKIDGLPNEHVIESDSSVLSWIPEYYEDDIVVTVCAYSDGACREVCSRHLRLKARTPDNVKMQIVTSVDPERTFCPGESIDFTVALQNEGYRSDIHWYRDIFDKGTGRSKTFVMDQQDTWVRAIFEPSEEMCVERTIMDSVFLKVKKYVRPSLRIENNIHDTLACQGDTILFHAIWTDAGEQPEISWRQDIWDRGYGEYALVGLNDKDTWVKCILKPGNDVCFDQEPLQDSMVIRVREAGTLTIFTDMTDKHPGDELIFGSKVEGMSGSWNYNWYVNNRVADCEEEEYIADDLRQGDIVQASIGGNEVCINRIFSNEIVVNYEGFINRDTMITIYRGETVKNLNMLKPCDERGKVLFMIETPGLYGMSTINPNGMFNYIPNNGFIGTDWVRYVVLDKASRKEIASGYIYITVEDYNRFRIPNLITPNDDGLNDTWKLDFLVDYPNHRITVYNRYGNVVFAAANYQNDWDGTGHTKGSYVGQINLPNGVYTYVIELGDQDKTVLKSWIEIRANLNRRDYR